MTPSQALHFDPFAMLALFTPDRRRVVVTTGQHAYILPRTEIREGETEQAAAERLARELGHAVPLTSATVWESSRYAASPWRWFVFTGEVEAVGSPLCLVPVEKTEAHGCAVHVDEILREALAVPRQETAR